MTQIIAPGPPPLTDEAADRSLDLIDFMAAVVRGVDTIDVTPELRDRWRLHLVANYRRLSPTQRAWYATADTAFAALATSWSSLPDERRNTNRTNWSLTLPSVLQFAEPVLGGTPASAAQPPPMPTAKRSSVADLITTMQEGQQQHAQEVYDLAGGGEAGLAAKAKVQAEYEALNMSMLTEMTRLRIEAMHAVWKK
jgi:hypothetical protein